MLENVIRKNLTACRAIRGVEYLNSRLVKKLLQEVYRRRGAERI